MYSFSLKIAFVIWWFANTVFALKTNKRYFENFFFLFSHSFKFYNTF